MASSDHTNKPTARVIDLAAEIRRAWGPEWNDPSIAYRFGERTFYLRTDDAGIYNYVNLAYVADDYIIEQGLYVSP